MKRTNFLILASVFLLAVNFYGDGFANQAAAGAIPAARFLSLKPYEQVRAKKVTPARYLALEKTIARAATKPKNLEVDKPETLAQPISGDKNKLLLSIYSEAK